MARLAIALLALLLAGSGHATWDDIEQEARGETVYFNAWGGDFAINRYIEWAAGELREQRDIELRHVKVTDIAEAVTRIKAERVAGRDRDGSIDLLWINGENYAALRRDGLLYGPWTSQLPNASLIDWQGNPTTRQDGMLPTAGFELPWGTSALTFFHDTARVPVSPRSAAELLDWLQANPGRFSYPQPPAFVGTAFLKQMLLLLVDDPRRLQAPAKANARQVMAPLWQWLDAAHPAMWRGGRRFPGSGPALRELLAVGELDWMLSYNPSEARRAIRQGDLQPTIAATYLDGGALANSHFLAIPYNARATAGAMVVANFLLSPAAQLRKADPEHWGDPTVLRPGKLPPPVRRQLERQYAGDALPPAPPALLHEPHPSWTSALEREWQRRYVR